MMCTCRVEWKHNDYHLLRCPLCEASSELLLVLKGLYDNRFEPDKLLRLLEIDGKQVISKAERIQE